MFKQGDIVLVPIPFTNLSSNKRRPVLILSNNDYNKSTNDILVVAITSNLSDMRFGIMIKTDDLSEGELKVDLQIRADKIYTLSQDIVIKRFGALNNCIIDKVKNKIDEMINNKSS